MSRLSRALRVCLMLPLLASCTARTASAPLAVASSGTAGELYVCNQNDATVSVIDLATQRVVRTIDLQRLGFSANAKPHHIAAEPDGSFWYVTLIGDNRIVKLDRNDRVVAQVAFETPGMLALHPTQDMLFVGRSMTAVNPPPRIGVLRRSDMQLEELPVFFPRPHALVLEPRSGTVYTASLGVNQLAAVDPRTEDIKLIDVAGPPHALMQFAVSPDGRTLAVSAELSHKVLLYDISAPMTPRLLAEIPVEAQPFDPIFTRDGRAVYLGNKAANAVTIIDVAERRVVKVLRGRGLAQPHGIASSPDGRRIYISNNNTGQAHAMSGPEAHAAPAAPTGKGTVVVIDTAAREIIDVIEVGNNASGIAIRLRTP